jgi:TrmH family RNA methyltransferase
MINTQIISSCSNPLIKEIAQLKNAWARKTSGFVIAEGIRTVETMRSGNMLLKFLFYTQEHAARILDLADATTSAYLISEAVLHKIALSKTPSGLVGVFQQPIYMLDDIQAPGIVLANITDPGNMGTVIRSAVAFGAKSVVVVEGADAWGHKVVQASAGTNAHISIITCAWDQLVQIVVAKNILLNALVVDGPLLGKPEQRNQLLVVGNEAHGLPVEWQQQCQLRSTIAMPGGTESLNVAVAGSIALYVTTQNANKK